MLRMRPWHCPAREDPPAVDRAARGRAIGVVLALALAAAVGLAALVWR